MREEGKKIAKEGDGRIAVHELPIQVWVERTGVSTGTLFVKGHRSGMELAWTTSDRVRLLKHVLTREDFKSLLPGGNVERDDWHLIRNDTKALELYCPRGRARADWGAFFRTCPEEWRPK
jgi:hypothetical protein